MTFRDSRNKLICPGDVVVVAARRGSSIWLDTRRVVSVDGGLYLQGKGAPKKYLGGLTAVAVVAEGQ